MNKYFKKYKYVTVVGAVVVIMIFFIYSYASSNSHAKQTEGAIPVEQNTALKSTSNKKDVQTNQTQKATQTNNQIMIDIKGAVKHPGIYQGTTVNRIQEMIQKAGGFLKTADQNQVNLAQKITDEMVVYVPEKGEKVDVDLTQVTTNETSSVSGENVVNINTATVEALETLPGLGPSKAAAIISYREENGLFASVDDLRNVSGIGDKTFDKLKPSISVD